MLSEQAADTDPLNHRAIYDQVVAAGPSGITVASIRQALTGDWRLPTKDGGERKALRCKLLALQRRGCVREADQVLCPASRRHAFRFVQSGPFVDCSERLPQARNNQHTTNRPAEGYGKRVEIPVELGGVVSDLRRRFSPVLPRGRDQWEVGTMLLDTSDMVALAKGHVKVTELLGLC